MHSAAAFGWPRKPLQLSPSRRTSSVDALDDRPVSAPSGRRHVRRFDIAPLAARSASKPGWSSMAAGPYKWYTTATARGATPGPVHRIGGIPLRSVWTASRPKVKSTRHPTISRHRHQCSRPRLQRPAIRWFVTSQSPTGGGGCRSPLFGGPHQAGTRASKEQWAGTCTHGFSPCSKTSPTLYGVTATSDCWYNSSARSLPLLVAQARVDASQRATSRLCFLALFIAPSASRQ